MRGHRTGNRLPLGVVAGQGSTARLVQSNVGATPIDSRSDTRQATAVEICNIWNDEYTAPKPNPFPVPGWGVKMGLVVYGWSRLKAAGRKVHTKSGDGRTASRTTRVNRRESTQIRRPASG